MGHYCNDPGVRELPLQTNVKYRGFELSDRGVSATADKVEAIKGYPTPKNARNVRAFIGLASFYRRLVPNFVEIAKPLTALTRKNQEFACGPTQQDAFDCLKQKLSTTRAAFPEFWSAIHSDDRRIQSGYCGCVVASARWSRTAH